MCGIAGFSGKFTEDLLNRMGTTISYRGPDDTGLYFDRENEVGLVHRRLSIIDTSILGHQPLWDSARKACIVFNGEIYNYKKLRSDLISKGAIFRSSSDTEVLVNLYLHYGKEMLSMLNGIFAFALWDSRTRSLFLARDGVGVKPFYYSETTKGFLFASELKALLKDESVDLTINPEAINSYLTYLWSPAPHTILSSVKKLEPGYAMIVTNGTITDTWQFYDLPYDQGIEDLTEAEAISQVRLHVEKAVESQMIADVEVGAFLSGGLDSSSIVAFAKNFVTKKKLKCFTIGFKDDAFRKESMGEDLPYAKMTADHLGVDLRVIYVGHEMVQELENMIYHLDEPQADLAPLNLLFISRLARENGIKVLLSGAGGDDIFSGYRRHFALTQEKYWSWLPKPLRSGIGAISQLMPKDVPLGRRLAKAFKYADFDGDKRIISYFYWQDPEYLFNLYSEDWKEKISKISIDHQLNLSLKKVPFDTPRINRMLYLETKHFLADHNLNYTDKMGMAAGVEVRVPLLDLDLINLAARLPTKFKQNGRIGKWILKKAMAPYLPKEIINRPKTGFGAPLRYWLKHELCSLVDDILSSENIKKRGIFDAGQVKMLIHRDRSGAIDASYTVFSLMCIELWCRIFLDNKGVLK